MPEETVLLYEGELCTLYSAVDDKNEVFYIFENNGQLEESKDYQTLLEKFVLCAVAQSKRKYKILQ